MKIDVHAHYFVAEYLQRLERSGAAKSTSLMWKMNLVHDGLSGLDAHLGQMDAAGVDLQVLSVSGVLPYVANEAEAVEAAKLANDIYGCIVREQPRRFAAFACTPLPHVRAAVTEARRALDELGMVGITVGTVVLERSIAESAFNDFFAELNRRKAVVFIHPVGGSLGSAIIESSNLVWPVGAPLEDTVCMLQFLQADFPNRFPDLKIVLPHLGGFAPFLSARLDQLKGQFLPNSNTPPSVLAKYFWFDTVNANPASLRLTRDLAGADHLLMGTDYPFWRDDAFKLCVDYIGRAGLPAGEAEQILAGNAQRLLGL